MDKRKPIPPQETHLRGGGEVDGHRFLDQTSVRMKKAKFLPEGCHSTGQRQNQTENSRKEKMQMGETRVLFYSHRGKKVLRGKGLCMTAGKTKKLGAVRK